MSTKTRRRPGRTQKSPVRQVSHAARAAHTASATRPSAHPAVHRADSAWTSGTENRAILGTHQTSIQRFVSRQTKPRPGRYQQIERQRRNNLILKIVGGVVGAIVVLGIVYFISNGGSLATGTAQQKQYRYDVASPKTGALAPDFTLPSTTGGTVRLRDSKGKNVLLYFQEGIGCEGCWTQLKDIERAMGQFQQLGISNVITITTNPLDALKQKVADETISLPVLSDESFAVSRAYNATMYGMMAGSADGHTFILVGPDGRIRWRADYGGPPEYTMYVPINSLIADIKAGTHGN